MQSLRFLPLAWLLLGTLASAQLDLPNQMRGAKRDRSSKADKNGLVLPRARTSNGEAPAAADSPEKAPEAQPVEALPMGSMGLTERAAIVIEELGTLERYESDRARVFAAQLETLGEPGIQGARAALQVDSATALAVATRVLLRNGDEGDREQLWRRLQGRLPAPATHAMLSTAADADPTYLTDQRLVALLDHPQGVMRAAAARQLEERSRTALLPTLMPALESDRTDTRQRAVELVAGVVDPAAVPLLLARLGDESAKVAFRAAELLADFPSEVVEPELVGRVRATRRMFRSDCYALLSLIEREDRQGAGILDETYVPQLLENLRASEPFARGAAAVALAGIGFRSADREQTAWLDKEVPEQLLSVVVGNEFHRDYSSLLRPTRRRLALISGERFGADGPAWARWWLDSNSDFRARRATIDVQPGDERLLTLAFRGAVLGAEAFVLVGPDAPLPDAVLGEVIYIGPDEASALVRDLGRFGVFGPERLPGHYGGGATVQTLEVRIAGQDKRFSFSENADQEWFLETLTKAREIHARNRWQRFFDAESFASRRAFWESERAWWVEPRTEEQRQRRLAELILRVLSGSRSGDRDVLVEELTLLCNANALLGLEDAPRLRRVLSNELFYGDRAEALLALTLRAMSQTPSGVVDPRLARELFDDVYELFKETALDGLEQIVASTDASLAEELSEDRRAVARGVAAQRLAQLGGPSQVERLAVLLEDDIEVVQASAVEAIGRAGVDELETDVLVRARIGTRLVRMAALRAAGRLGADGAREALLATMGSGDAELQRAAVEGLALLADPSTAALMVSFVRRGPESPLYLPARAGVLALGEEAWPELRRLAISDRPELRREAGLLLAEQGAADAVPILIQLLLETPDDGRVLNELAILTCVDYRGDTEPARSWAAWWETAVQDGSLAWFRGAQERAGIEAAPLGALEGKGSLAGAQSLIETLALPGSPPIAERAERELERLLAVELERPADPALEAEWRALLRERAAEHYR